ALNVVLLGQHALQLEQYYELLRRWNRRMNLTALPLDELPSDEVLERLFWEPLKAADLLSDEPIEWLDVGSGGGSPAIPLKIVRRQLKLTMVEARARKAAFLREAARHLALADVEVLAERVESLRESLANSMDLITIRAVRIDSKLLEVLTDLLDPAGQLV